MTVHEVAEMLIGIDNAGLGHLEMVFPCHADETAVHFVSPGPELCKIQDLDGENVVLVGYHRVKPEFLKLGTLTQSEEGVPLSEVNAVIIQ